jgi:hypothetical protein
MNRRSCRGERRCAKSRGTPAERTAAFENENQASTPVRATRKPFDVLAEGLVSENSRGDEPAIELFVAGVRGWGSWRWRQLENSQST